MLKNQRFYFDLTALSLGIVHDYFVIFMSLFTDFDLDSNSASFFIFICALISVMVSLTVLTGVSF